MIFLRIIIPGVALALVGVCIGMFVTTESFKPGGIAHPAHITPQSGCNFFSHVEHHPQYGLICVQNEGSWFVRTETR